MRSTVAGLYSKVSHPSNWEVDFEMIISTKTRVFSSRANVNTKSRIQYVAPGPDEKDANVYFLPQKNSSELKFVLQFTVTFP